MNTFPARQREREAAKRLIKKDKQPAGGSDQKAKARQKSTPRVNSEGCRGCGRLSHETVDCKLIEGKHPDANTSSESFAKQQPQGQGLERGRIRRVPLRAPHR